MADVVPLRPSDDLEAGPDEALFARLKRQYAMDLEKAKTWREEAEEDYDFRDGEQWTPQEKAVLQEQMRPVVVFNRMGVLIDAVVGSEIGNRREVRYIPREMADGKANEILTSAAEWFRDQCDAEDEESEAFKDTVTAGMGWTETRLDYIASEAGEPKIERIDPFEMVWDCSATKANLVDTKRRWRVRVMDLDDAKEMFPDVEEGDLNAAWADDGLDDDPHHVDRRNAYGVDNRPAESVSRKVTIVAVQYEERETYYKALMLTPDAPTPQVVELDAKRHGIATKAGAVVQSVKLTRPKIVQCFLGATGLLEKPQPTQTGSFTWNCITGLPDKKKGTWYGIVRRAKDPQRWFNKWLSQNMHILNSQAKGGVMMEDGAAEDMREFERQWARPDAVTVLAKGALSNPTGARIQAKPVAQFPAGFAQLMQLADDFIIKCTGINMEMLGMRDAQQAGVLEYQRKQSGIAILASFFDSLRRYRKIQGRALLHLIQNFLADGRLVRIVGEEEARYVPLMKEQVASSEYDIIVDDSPTSPNEKERVWGLLQQVMPMFKDAIGPKEGLLIAEYSPMPTSLVQKLKALMEEGQNAGPSPEQQQAQELQAQQMQLEQMKLQLEMSKIAADREKTQSEESIAVMQNETERRRIEADSFTAASNAMRPEPERNFGNA